MCAPRASRRRSSASAGLARSRNALRLPAPVSRSKSSMVGRRSARMVSTSAPYEAKRREQAGPASTRVRSSTRTPASGERLSGRRSGGASPIFLSIMGWAARRPCTLVRHSSSLRTTAPQSCVKASVSSSAGPLHLETLSRIDCASLLAFNRSSVRIAWRAKPPCR